MSVLLIALLIWLGSGVVALMALLTIGRRGLPARGSTVPKREREESLLNEAVETERKAA
jgi:hypothetical protein